MVAGFDAVRRSHLFLHLLNEFGDIPRTIKLRRAPEFCSNPSHLLNHSASASRLLIIPTLPADSE